jgi:catechol 2,3-dioxygenase-like lactoylglutathione lyase family enzyme
MSDKKINLVRIAHVFYQHKNIDAARTFYEDFGMLETARVGNRTYYRGYGTEPFVVCAEEGDSDVFLGPAFVVESLEDLEHASKTLPDATEIYDLAEKKGAPGGGKCVTFKDPNDGFYFHLVHGQEALDLCEPHFPQLKVNYVCVLERRGEKGGSPQADLQVKSPR